MAGAIADLANHTLRGEFRRIDPRRARVILAEGSNGILKTFPDKLSARAQRDLERLGVEVHAGKAITDINEGGVMLGGAFIPSRTIIWAAGVQASPAGAWLGAAQDRAGRVIVDPDLTLPGHPDVFVIGDTAASKSADGAPVPGLAPAAAQQGKYAARVIAARLNGKPPSAPFSYRNYGTMATIGRAKAIADFKRFTASGLLAWLLWGLIHLMPLVGFRNRFIVACDWLWSYFTHERGVRLITVSRTKDGEL
jgi:NADH dehydrogenase